MSSVKQMLFELIESGKSQSGLARELGTTQSTINRAVKKGQSVSYELGKKIELMHAESIKKKAA